MKRLLRFGVTVLEDGRRAVNVHPCNDAHAIEAMRAAGVEIRLSDEVLKTLRHA